MPRRGNKDTLINKQKKLIENRLIQISLIVEDYVYNHKPISSTKAEMYVKEVNSYKDKCFDDERSLQVIEKLVRCMKGIITEQGDKSSGLVDINLPPSSPLYSVLENLTQTPQNSDAIKPKSKTKHNPRNKKIHKKVKNTPNNGKKGLTRPLTANINEVTVDLCSDDTHDVIDNAVDKRTVENIDTVTALQRDLSNLSITNTEIITSITEECSQSILSEFYIQEQINLNNMKTKEKMSLTTPILNPDPKNHEELLQNKGTEVTPSAAKYIMAEGKLSNERNSKIISERNNVKILESIETNDTTPKVNKRHKPEMVKTDEAKAKKTKSVQPYIKNIASNQDTSRKFRNKVNKRRNINNRKTKAGVYNNLVENDLSWMENIRYVREIATEEYERVSLADNFWDNFSLPDNWNNDDFL